MRIWAGWLFLRPATIRPRSFLCIRCRDAGVITEADLSNGPKEQDGHRLDQWGGLYPS